MGIISFLPPMEQFLFIHKEIKLNPFGPNGGAETATLSLTRALASVGHKVILACNFEGDDFTKDGVTFWNLTDTYNVFEIFERAKKLNHYHLVSTGLSLPIVISKNFREPITRMLYSHDPSGNASGLKAEALTSYVDSFIFVSQAHKKLGLEAGIPESQTFVNYNGARHDIFTPAPPQRGRKIVFAGALVQDKGIHVLINAYQEVKKVLSDVTLDIYGSASLWGRTPLFNEKEVEAQIPGITFHGAVNQETLVSAYQTAGLCVTPSIWFDTFNLVSVEAQACGCPVMSFNVGGIPETFINHVSGILVEEISENALANSIIQFFSNDSQRISFSEQAVKNASSFDWTYSAQRLVTLCKDTATRKELVTSSRKAKVGVLTTWNQKCGLATYAKYLFGTSDLNPIILAENASSVTEDEPSVIRCWNRSSGDYTHLLQEIKKLNIEILHINFQTAFFSHHTFKQFLTTCKEIGVFIIAHPHSLFTKNEFLQAILSASDITLVHHQESSVEAAAHGARKVISFPHGVHIFEKIAESERKALRASLGAHSLSKIITAFGFVQPHKGMEGVISSVAYCKSKGIDALGVIAGGENPSDPQSPQYLSLLKQYAKDLGVESSIRFISKFLSDTEVSGYLQASDAILMNYKSQHYEASGACSLALGAHALVATSTAPAFTQFGDSVFHITAGYPAELAIELILSDTLVQQTLRASAQHYIAQYSWAEIQKLYASIIDTHWKRKTVLTPSLLREELSKLSRQLMY